MSVAMLTKRTLDLFDNCPKSAWLHTYHKRLATPPSQEDLLRFDQGRELGELARNVFPGGQLLPELDTPEELAAQTAEALATPGPVTLYEATFVAGDLQCRCDILERFPDGTLHIIEVKSGGALKPDYIADIAFQAYVLTAAGYSVSRCSLCLINRDFILDDTFQASNPNANPTNPLFVTHDVTDPVTAIASDGLDLEELRRTLDNPNPPEIPTNTYCKDCPFIEVCTQELTDLPVWRLPRITRNAVERLYDDGIVYIKDIPDDRFVSPGARLAYRSIADNQRYIHPSVKDTLLNLPTPIAFVDFEAVNPAFPLFLGTHPFQGIPFQWSLHWMEDPHIAPDYIGRPFLHTTSESPIQPFLDSLHAAVKDAGTIVFYSNYEVKVLTDLAAEGYPLADECNTLFRDRGFDLHELIRRYVAWPEFRARTTIKNVLPAIAPHLDYKQLNISNGGEAMALYTRAIRNPSPTVEDQKIFDDLIEYCNLDTWAMVEIYRALLTAPPLWPDNMDSPKTKRRR